MCVKIMEDQRGKNMRELMGKVITELGHVFDVLSKSILKNKKDIIDLQTRMKELEVTALTLFNRMDKK